MKQKNVVQEGFFEFIKFVFVYLFFEWATLESSIGDKWEGKEKKKFKMKQKNAVWAGFSMYEDHIENT